VKGVLSFAISLGLSSAFLAAQPPPRDLSLAPVRIQKKLALIIGNQSYPKSPLKNPLNDAAAMAKALRGLGFDEVVEKTDLTMRQMRFEIDRFSANLQQGDLALFTTSGRPSDAKVGDRLKRAKLPPALKKQGILPPDRPVAYRAG
jgi:hypothetical protein